jgi:hypothetical protein
MKQESGPVMMQAIRLVLAKRINLSDEMSALSSSMSLPSAPKLRRSSD